MKSLWIVAALVVYMCASAAADPIILAPSGRTLSTGQVRAEAALSSDNDNGKYFWLGTGLMQVEANVIRLDHVNGRTENRIGAQWNFIPEVFGAPAVAFGVQDAGSQSEDGIGIYVVATKRLDVGNFVPLVKQFSATAGIGAGGIRGPFLGLEAKLPLGLFVQGEYDSRDFNAAVGWQPIELLRLKAYTIRDNFYFGAELPLLTF